jgi:heme-degrading monooxygenase HmoA
VWVRVSRFQLPAGDREKVLEQFHYVVDAFGEQPGLRQVDVWVHPRSGAALTVTTWESEEAMKASEDQADSLRSHIAMEVLGWVDRVDEYEVVRSDVLPSPHGPPRPARGVEEALAHIHLRVTFATDDERALAFP